MNELRIKNLQMQKSCFINYESIMNLDCKRHTMQRKNKEKGEEKNNREQGSHMDWHEATSASGERPAVHPDCRRSIKISYISLSLS